jgi:hypothetical protein
VRVASRPGSSVGLSKGIFAVLRRQPPPIRVAPILLESASLASDVVYRRWFGATPPRPWSRKRRAMRAESGEA